MPRANRTYCAGHIWHITHRCHQRQFLLRFARDRRAWRDWLFRACRRYGLCVLNYIATSNHVHLLILDRGKNEIPAAMQLVAGRTGQDYNRRKNRRGAFWEDRYHSTAVQADGHLHRCIVYIDLNMVRAGRVSNPADWDVSGFHEIQQPAVRKGIVDHAALCDLLNLPSVEHLRQTHAAWLNAELAASTRHAAWTESLAVGDKKFLETFRRDQGISCRNRSIVVDDDFQYLRDDSATYLLFSTSKNAD